MVLVYLRVSTEEQAKSGYSLPEQREACYRKARELSSAPIQEFVDDFGGDIAERPVLEATREFVRKQKPSHFVCMDPDRFSRSLMLQLLVADEIEKAGVQLAFVQHEYHRTAEGQLFFQMRGAIAQFEKAKITERTSRGKRGKVKAGQRPNGACPYGYVHDKATDTLIVVEPLAAWVREMYVWSSKGEGVHTISRRLNELGVPTKRGKGKWHRTVVHDILRNSSYKGEMTCNKKDFSGVEAIRRLPKDKRRSTSATLRPQVDWVTVPVPAIVDDRTWQLVQDNMDRARKGGPASPGLLSGLVRCGECGGHMVYVRHSGTGRTYLRCRYKYAKLQGFYGAQDCTAPHQRAQPIEEKVWDAVVTWIAAPEKLEQYLNGQTVPSNLPQLRERLNAMGELRKEKLSSQVVIIKQQTAGRLDEEVANQMLDEIKTHVQALDTELASLRAAIQVQEATSVEFAMAGIREIADRIAAEGDVEYILKEVVLPENRRQILLDAIREVVVSPDGSVNPLPRVRLPLS